LIVKNDVAFVRVGGLKQPSDSNVGKFLQPIATRHCSEHPQSSETSDDSKEDP
jgi:hypothetical protein